MAVIAPSTAPVAAAGPLRAHYLEWGPVILGALGATAISVVLLTFGAALGLSVVSPYPYAGISAKGLAVLTGTYVALVTVASFGAGGYLAGRLRAPWPTAAGPEAAELHFRDGSYGFGVWALGVLLGSALAVSGVGGVLKAAVHTTTTVAAAGTAGAASNPAAGAALNRLSMEPTDFAVDRVLAPGPGGARARTGWRRSGTDAGRTGRADRPHLRREPRQSAAQCGGPHLSGATRHAADRHAAGRRREACRHGLHRPEGRRAKGSRRGRARAQGHAHRSVPGGRDLGHRLRRRLCRGFPRRTPSRRKHPGRVLGFAPLLVIAARPDKARPGCDRSRAYCFFDAA